MQPAAREKLGRTIHQARLAKGETQAQFAERVTRYSGASVIAETVSNWENAISIPQPRHTKALARAARITLADFAALVLAAVAERKAELLSRRKAA
jgi:transcriptional regulator with XRE-family HTH domain